MEKLIDVWIVMLKVTETEARQVLKNAFGPLKTELLQNNI
jgi:hypothetical protein